MLIATIFGNRNSFQKLFSRFKVMSSKSENETLVKHIHMHTNF